MQCKLVAVALCTAVPAYYTAPSAPSVAELFLAYFQMFDASAYPLLPFATAHTKRMDASFEEIEHLSQTTKKSATLSPVPC